MTMRVLRYEVPVDDETHAVPCGHGPIIHVDCRDPRVVEFWRAIDDQEVEASTALRTFVVVGTGQEIPIGGTVLGSALTPATLRSGVLGRGELVWHLVEIHHGKRVDLTNLVPGGDRRFA